MKISITLSLTALLLLVGCVSTQDGSISQQEGVTQNDTQEDILDNYLDNEIFNDAVASKDSNKCKEIVDSEMEESCENLIEYSIITDNAIQSLDLTACDEIEDERYRENCINEVDELISINKENEEFDKIIEEYTSITREAEEKGDISYCDKIEDVDQKQICIMNVIIDPNYEGSDPSVCEKIGNEMLVEDCKIHPKWNIDQ